MKIFSSMTALHGFGHFCNCLIFLAIHLTKARLVRRHALHSRLQGLVRKPPPWLTARKDHFSAFHWTQGWPGRSRALLLLLHRLVRAIPFPLDCTKIGVFACFDVFDYFIDKHSVEPGEAWHCPMPGREKAPGPRPSTVAAT